MRRILPWAFLAPIALLGTATAAPVIHEIFFRAPGAIEDPGQEWLEIQSDTAEDLSGWKLTKGVDFTMPPGTSIAAGGFVVVAADVAKFQAAHPGFAGTVVGGWVGKLSNSGETLQLENSLGVKVHAVDYATEGDGVLRARGELSLGHRGWQWICPADGGGSSFELKNRAWATIPTNRIWASSTAVGGTPGAANSEELSSAFRSTLVYDVKHKPDVPKSTEDIKVYAKLTSGGITNRYVRWKPVTSTTWTIAAFMPREMPPIINANGFSEMVATIPAQSSGTVIEYYLEPELNNPATVNDSWPMKARTSNPGVLPETFANVTNAMVLVDDTFDAATDFTQLGNQPIYRLLMSEADRMELAAIGSTPNEEESLATMNGTFISHDGTGVKIRHLCGFRNRGQGSALGPPNNFHIGFPAGDAWEDMEAFALNCQYGYSQMLGQALFEMAGFASQESAIVRATVNGVNLAETGNRMYGRYVRLEGRGADWAENHYPNDPLGNFYRLDDHLYPPGDPRSGEFSWEGTDPASYSDTFIKETNKAENDYSDLINLAKIVGAPASGGTAALPAISNAAYPAAVATVLDVDHFYRYLAVDALIGNQEGGLQSGRADDVSIYRGVVDPRFRFVPHDLDDVFDIGNGAGNLLNRSIFSYDISSGGVTGLSRMLNHPQLLPKYYSALLDAMNTWFDHESIDPVIDHLLAGWVPAADGTPGVTPFRSINDIKGYIDIRRADVLSQIQQNYSSTLTGTTLSTEGYQVTTTGAVGLSGTFNVAKTYSVTVNGQAANFFYRTAGANTAGTWNYTVPAGGGGVLAPGLNKLIVRMWDGIDGTGNVLHEVVYDVAFNSATSGTTVSGVLAAPGNLSLTMPQTYVPGVPVLVRVDLKDANGAVNRSAWNTTVNLTSTNGVALIPSTVTLYNGMGSALVSFGATTGGGTVNYFTYGTGGENTALPTGTLGSTWRIKWDHTSTTMPAHPANWNQVGFDDSAWQERPTRTGYASTAKNQTFPRVDYLPATAGTVDNVPTYFFRSKFTVADKAALASITGQITYDDSYVIYVNGTEISRSSNVAAGSPYTSYASAASVDNATAPVTIPLANVVNGENTVAVEIRQGSATSSDVTFDFRLAGNLISTSGNPGNFTLTATGGGLTATKAMTSLFGTAETVAPTSISAATTWSGIVRVNGDVTVNAGGSLTIQPGTHVLMNGTSAPGDTAGADIIVNSGGTLTVGGTQADPVSITSGTAGGKWGQILLNGSDPCVMDFAHISAAGHAPGAGHTGRGPVLRLTGANITLNDCSIGDSPGKALYSSGTSDYTMKRSLMARMITGPETENNTAILVEDSNIQEILPNYRESNAPAPDDEDCFYVHNGAGRSVITRNTVFARCGDDVFDCLGGPITVERCILRDGWDKGMSMLNNDLTISDTLIINCDKAIVPKSDTATTRTTTVNRCTIVSENHNTTLAPFGYSVPPNNPDADTPSTGLYTQNKSGQSNAAATLSIIAKDCIIIAESPILVDAPYAAANTVVSYSLTRDSDTPATSPWPGTDNINTDPIFVSAASGNYRLSAGSPAINTGDVAETDPDGSRRDMGALPTGVLGSGGGGVPGEVRWTLAGSPYLVSANFTVPSNLTLRVDAGVSVHFNQNVRLTVNGRMIADGTPNRRIVFSHVPGAVAPGDSDPIKLGTQTGSPKWGGIRVTDSMAQENIFKYCDFINAQGTDPATSENNGSLGFIRSWGFCEGLTFAGSHLRLLYGKNSKLTVFRCTFPTMFIFDPVLGRIESPIDDFLASADNRMEPLKVEFPTGDPEVSGANAVNFPNGLPLNGHWRVYANKFGGNRGHQDVFDADSGRWSPRDAVTNFQTNGQFMLDCRFNHFQGLAGDEHIDLGGDAYIASNILENASKDFWTNDTGYSNAISSGDKGSGTTIMIARNICYDLDHVINCKAGTATIFEHNTVADINPDFLFQGATVSQNVQCAPINFFIPGDGTNPTYGDGAYMGYNIVSNVPRLFSGPDARKVNNVVVNDVTSKIEFFHNLLNQITDPNIGPNHPGGIFAGTYGPNEAGAPSFEDPASENYALGTGSVARGTAPGGINYGASIPEWAYVINNPQTTVASGNVSLTIGGPGIVAFKYRVDGGAWSLPIQIGAGGLLPRDAPTVRQHVLNLTLAPGQHAVEVLGQDMAGNWQGSDPAATLLGLPQAQPTGISISVDPAVLAIRISEVNPNGTPDTVELQNLSSSEVLLTGWSLRDAAGNVTQLTGRTLPANGYLVVNNPFTLTLNGDGDSISLLQSTTVKDSVTWGHIPATYTFGRKTTTGEWLLNTASPGAANTFVQLGDAKFVRLNEWLASSDIRYKDDFVELHNTSSLPVSLTGYFLTDNPAGAPQLQSLAGSFIAPNGYLVLKAEDLAFQLSAQQEVLALFNGSVVQDQVSFYPHTDDYSQGRNATGVLTWYGFPTPGLANETTDANAQAILTSLRITEIMYNAPGGNQFDWLELTNIGTTALDLTGVHFVEGITYSFPSGTMLAAGQSIILAADPALFLQRYGNPVGLAVFQYTGRLNNDGEEIAIRLADPFTANVLCFDFRDSWYAAANAGSSLVLTNTGSTLSDHSERDSWNISSTYAGSPAGVIVTNPGDYQGWLGFNATQDLVDTDKDGFDALAEYALGINPHSPNGTLGAQSGPAVSTPVDKLKFSFKLPANTSLPGGYGRTDVLYSIQASTSLEEPDWADIATKGPTDATWQGPANVNVTTDGINQRTMTVTDEATIANGQRRFIRVSFSVLP